MASVKKTMTDEQFYQAAQRTTLRPHTIAGRTYTTWFYIYRSVCAIEPWEKNRKTVSANIGQ